MATQQDMLLGNTLPMGITDPDRAFSTITMRKGFFVREKSRVTSA
jgi:hypothetical protein